MASLELRDTKGGRFSNAWGEEELVLPAGTSWDSNW